MAGGAIAGLSGGILVTYVTTWSPAAWGYAETVVLFAAVIIGGAGNHLGAILGANLGPAGFEEITRFIPTSSVPNLIPSLQWVAIGLLIVVFLWLRPQGILPERKRIIHAAPARSSGRASPGGPGGSRAPAQGQRPEPEEDRPVLLEMVDVVREFGGVRAAAGVSIQVRKGTLTGLIGPNGAGKLTLLAMLAGTLPVTSGTITYEGRDVTGMPAFRRARLGLVRTFQLASEFKKLTVMENLLSAVRGNRGTRSAAPCSGRATGRLTRRRRSPGWRRSWRGGSAWSSSPITTPVT